MLIGDYVEKFRLTKGLIICRVPYPSLLQKYLYNFVLIYMPYRLLLSVDYVLN